MGEENTIAGAGNTFYFCPTKDVGTEREKWNEAKLDSIKVLDAIEVPELDFEKITGDNSPKERKGFPNSFSISFELAAESMRKFGSALKKAQRRESGSRHYRRKLLKHVPKKKLRRWRYIMRKLNLKSDIV